MGKPRLRVRLMRRFVDFFISRSEIVRVLDSDITRAHKFINKEREAHTKTKIALQEFAEHVEAKILKEEGGGTPPPTS